MAQIPFTIVFYVIDNPAEVELRLPTLDSELKNIWLVKLDAQKAGVKRDYQLPGLVHPELDTMEVDLREAALFSSYDPQTRILSVFPNVDIQGSSECGIKLTSSDGVVVDLTFKIFVSFINMAIYRPPVVIINDDDPVGRRNITTPSIDKEITEITSTGLVTISFDPPVPQDVLQKALQKDVVVKIWSDDDRSDTKKNLEFLYQYTEVSPSHLKMQLLFNETSYVMRDDYLLVYFHREIFNSSVYYKDNEDYLRNLDQKNITRSFQDYDRIHKQMPAQMTQNTYNMMTVLNVIVRILLLVELIVLVIASLLFFASLYYVWILIDSLQLICFTLLLDVGFPANFHNFLLSLSELVFFKRLDGQESMTGIPTSQNQTINFSQAGLHSSNIFIITGPLLYIFLLCVLLMIVAKTVLFCLRKLFRNRSLPKQRTYQCNTTWSAFMLRFAFLIYLTLTLGAVLNCYSMSIETASESLSTLAAVTLSIGCFGFPVYVYLKLFKRPETPNGLMYEDQSYRMKYGSLYEGLRVKKPTSLMLSVAYLIRRLAYVLVICLLNTNPLAQVSLLLLIQFFVIAYLGENSPYMHRRDNWLVRQNEFSVLWVLALCLGYASPSIEGPVRAAMGWFGIAVVLYTLVINSALILIQLGKDLQLWAKRCRNLRNAQPLDSKIKPNQEELDNLQQQSQQNNLDIILEESSENGSQNSRRRRPIEEEYPTQMAAEDTNMNLITQYSEQEQRQINRFLQNENTMEESDHELEQEIQLASRLIPVPSQGSESMQEQHDKLFSSINGMRLVKGHSRRVNSGTFDGIENPELRFEQPYLEKFYNTLQQNVPKGLYDRLSRLNNGSKNRNTIGSSSKDLPQNLSTTFEHAEIKDTKYETESEKGLDESSQNMEQTRPTLGEDTVEVPSQQQRLVNPFDNILQSRPAASKLRKKPFTFDPSHGFPTNDGAKYQFEDPMLPWMCEPETSYNSGRILKLKKVKNPKTAPGNTRSNLDVKKVSSTQQDSKAFAWSRHLFTNQPGKSPKRMSANKYGESNDGATSHRSTFGGVDSRPDSFVKALKKVRLLPKENPSLLQAFDTEVQQRDARGAFLISTKDAENRIISAHNSVRKNKVTNTHTSDTKLKKSYLLSDPNFKI